MNAPANFPLRDRLLATLPGLEKLRPEDLENGSCADLFRVLTPAARKAALRRMGDDACERLMDEWAFWARPKQWYDPHDHEQQNSLWMTGRGFGKTRTGAETCHMMAEHYAEECGGEIALIGQTATDMRDIMIEGKSGIMATAKPWFTPIYEPSKMKVTWPNGVTARIRTSEKPSLIRGLSVGFAWCDEIAHWMDPEECWDNLQFALREGNPSKIIATTTPLPTPFIRKLIADTKQTRVIRGSTMENAEHLDRGFIPKLQAAYGRNAKGRQEMWGEIVEDCEGAPFKTDHIGRIARDQVPPMAYMGVGIDPAGGTAAKKSDETGIIGGGIDWAGNLYMMVDRSEDVSSANWSARAVDLGMVLRAEYGVETPVEIVGEINFGGDMVERVIQTTPKWAEAGLRFEMVRAFADKSTRADPIGTLAELGRYYHVGTGTHFARLEAQMTQFNPDLPRKKQQSPDRMDAMVHLATRLIERLGTGGRSMAAPGSEDARSIMAALSRGFRA